MISFGETLSGLQNIWARFLLLFFRQGKLASVNDPSSSSYSQTTTAAQPRETAATRHIDRRANGRAREMVATAVAGDGEEVVRRHRIREQIRVKG